MFISDPDPAKSFGSLRIRFRFRIRIRNTVSLCTTYVYFQLKFNAQLCLKKGLLQIFAFSCCSLSLQSLTNTILDFLPGRTATLCCLQALLSITGIPLKSLSYLNHNALIPLYEGSPLSLGSLHLRQITEVNIRHLLRPLDST
jgi:hypothetical protein